MGLRVMGHGNNRICFTHVDNYCHALILGERSLYDGSPVLGKFYIATDGDTHPDPAGCCVMWEEIDRTVVHMGFPSIMGKSRIPYWLMMAIAVTVETVAYFL